jgi:hypothetical protein
MNEYEQQKLREDAAAVREFLSDKSRWTRGYFARDKEGEPVEARDATAVCWCTAGAIIKVVDARLGRANRLMEALNEALISSPESEVGVVQTNDHLPGGYDLILKKLAEIAGGQPPEHT